MTSDHEAPGTTVTMAPARPELVRWPAERPRRRALADEGRPCLLVVADGAPIPAIGPAEDWIRATAGEADVAARLAHLGRTTATPVFPPAAGLLAALSDWRLDPAAGRVLQRLASQPGRLVPTASLEDAARPGRPTTDLAARLRELAEPLARLGWHVVAIDGAGHLLERRGPER